MEEDSPSKPSVAELAGRFKGHILPRANSNDQLPFRRRPPCSLKLQYQKDENEESDQTAVAPKPFKIKVKNSAIIEKLQANLALSPSSLLPSTNNSPDVRVSPPAPCSPPTSTQWPIAPCSPPTLSPTQMPSHLSSEEQDPVSFSDPPEGETLPSFNKTRARLSFKRRPPTRQHRRSAGEDQLTWPSPTHNGGDRALHSPKEEEEKEEEEEEGHRRTLGDPEKDCEQAPDEFEKQGRDLEEEQDKSKETFGEENQSSENWRDPETEEEQKEE